MRSGRSAEELSSERKALTFAKGPCNKAKNFLAGKSRCGDVRALGCRWGWDRSTGLGTGQECPERKRSQAGVLGWWDDMVKLIGAGGSAGSWLGLTPLRSASTWV